MELYDLFTPFYYNSQTTTGDSALNIVFGINTNQQFWQDKFSKTFATETWIFILEFTWNTSEALIIDSINDTFRNKSFITLNAKIYVLARKESLLMFEIYKKASLKYLTINLICNDNIIQQEWKKSNKQT